MWKTFAGVLCFCAAVGIGATAAVPFDEGGSPRSAVAGWRADFQLRVRPFDPGLLETGDLIRYRLLSKDDFLAGEPPAEAADIHDQLGAATCVFLATHPEMMVRAFSRGVDARQGRVRAQVENLSFVALMDRECSWWNPAPVSLPQDYILEHEQIHFAIFEVAARRLNERAGDISHNAESVSATQDGAVYAVRQRLDAELQGAMSDVLTRSRQLDLDTSRTYARERQRRWARQVEDELRQLGISTGGG